MVKQVIEYLTRSVCEFKVTWVVGFLGLLDVLGFLGLLDVLGFLNLLQTSVSECP